MKVRKRHGDWRTVAIDPGLSGTGWAVWAGDRHVPVSLGIVHDTARDEDLAIRCYELSEKLLTRCLPTALPLYEVFIEMPQAMFSAKGIAAQAGSVYKLTFLVGYLARSFYPAGVHVVTPMEWKGQLPKEVVQSRVERTLGTRVCHALNIRSHAWDAVGLGLWANGVFK